jgi:spermidine synthase
VVLYGCSRRPLRFGLGMLGMIVVTGALGAGQTSKVLYTERTFFGINQVLASSDGRFHVMVHGTTMHGMQSQEPERAREPLTYYHPTGPIGQVFAAFNGAEAKQRVGVVGLGAGSMACYAGPGQTWTFYEIDAAVERIARDPRYFTFLRDCAPQANVVLGDARLSLRGAPNGGFDLLVLDAYSSDAIPIHLLTREAAALYLDKLAPDGVLVFHISNVFFDLEPVLSNLAAETGLVARTWLDTSVSAELAGRGKSVSQWVILARDSAALGPLAADQRWRPLNADPSLPTWTDDYSSILSVLKR